MEEICIKGKPLNSVRTLWRSGKRSQQKPGRRRGRSYLQVRTRVCAGHLEEGEEGAKVHPKKPMRSATTPPSQRRERRKRTIFIEGKKKVFVSEEKTIFDSETGAGKRRNDMGPERIQLRRREVEEGGARVARRRREGGPSCGSQEKPKKGDRDGRSNT